MESIGLELIGSPRNTWDTRGWKLTERVKRALLGRRWIILKRHPCVQHLLRFEDGNSPTPGQHVIQEHYIIMTRTSARRYLQARGWAPAPNALVAEKSKSGPDESAPFQSRVPDRGRNHLFTLERDRSDPILEPVYLLIESVAEIVTVPSHES